MNIFDHIAKEEANLQTEEVADVNEVMPEVEEVNSEIITSNAEITNDLSAIEEAEADIETQENIIGIAEDTIEDGGEGMSEDGVEVLEASMESFARRLRMPYERIFPAKEAYGSSTGSRRQATRVAVENAKEYIVKGWEKLKTAFMWVWEKISKLYDSMFNKVAKLESLQESVAGKVKRSGDDWKEVEKPSLVRAIADETGANGASVKNILESADRLMGVGKKLPDFIKVYANAIESNDALERVYSGLSFMKDFGSTYFLSGGKKMDFFNDAKENTFSLKISELRSVPDKGEALNKSSAVEILKASRETIENIKKFKETKTKIEGAQSFIGKVIDRIISKIKSPKSANEVITKLNKELADSLRKNASDLYKMILPNAFGAVKGALEYVNASMGSKNSESKDTKEPEPASEE